MAAKPVHRLRTWVISTAYLHMRAPITYGFIHGRPALPAVFLSRSMSAVWKWCVETPAPKPILLTPTGGGVGLACSMGIPMLPVQDLQVEDQLHSRRPLLLASLMPLRALATLMSESASTPCMQDRSCCQDRSWAYIIYKPELSSWAKHCSLQQDLYTHRCATTSAHICVQSTTPRPRVTVYLKAQTRG